MDWVRVVVFGALPFFSPVKNELQVLHALRIVGRKINEINSTSKY